MREERRRDDSLSLFVLIPSDLTGIPSFLLFYHLFGCKKETEEEKRQNWFCTARLCRSILFQLFERSSFVVACLME